MYKYEIHPDLDKILFKIGKKDRVQLERILSKIDEIIHSSSLNHYKNLKRPLQKYKRVHVYSSFVLLFTVNDNTIIFSDYGHHDGIYNN